MSLGRVVESTNHLFLGLDLGSGGAFPEPILEPPRHGLHVPHTAGARRAPTFGLECPIVLSHLAGGIATTTTLLLLDVVGNLAAPATGRVRLVFSFSKGGRTFRLLVLSSPSLYCSWQGSRSGQS